METSHKKLPHLLASAKKNGSLTVVFALFAEFLIIGYLAFAALFSLETLLPNIIGSHIDLTLFFAVLLLFTFALLSIGHFLAVEFILTVSWKNPWLWLGSLWSLGILAISLYRFPLWSIPIILVGFGLVASLFARIFFDRE